MERDQQVAALIKAACGTNDKEANHSVADSILCELLRELGFNETVAAFEAIEKWYA